MFPTGKSIQFLVSMTHFLSVADLKKCVFSVLTGPGFQEYRNANQHVKKLYFKYIILMGRESELVHA